MLNTVVWRGDAAPPFEPPATRAAAGQRTDGGRRPRTPAPVRSWLSPAPVVVAARVTRAERADWPAKAEAGP